MSKPPDHHLSGKQALVAFAVCGCVLAALLGPPAYRELFLPLPSQQRAILIASLLFAAVVSVIGLFVFRVASEFIGAMIFRFFAVLLIRFVPKHILARAAERRLHPAVVALVFASLFAVLLLIFQNFLGVVAGLLCVAALLGIPILLNKVEQWLWRVILRRKTKAKTSEPEPAPNGGPATQ